MEHCEWQRLPGCCGVRIVICEHVTKGKACLHGGGAASGSRKLLHSSWPASELGCP